MSKLDKLVIANSDGEILENGQEIYDSIKREERIKEIKRIEYLINNEPNKLSLIDIEKYMQLNDISPSKIEGFSAYHQINENFDTLLFETGITMKSYYYFNFLVAHYCSNCYTLKFKNEVNITKDAQIQEKLNLSERQWREIKAELLKLNIIKVITFDKIKYYKVNPCYIGKKKILTTHTYHAFRDDLIKFKLINKVQVIYWDKYMQEEFMVNYAEKPQETAK